MNPFIMALILLVGVGAFAYSARRRWRLMMIGSSDFKFDQIPKRIKLTMRLVLGQQRLGRYPIAGFAHKAIFFGFIILMLRSLILFARGFTDDPDFGYWIFDSETLLGDLYSLIKDFYVVLVILGTVVFLYYRIVVKLKRMTLSREGVVILIIILVMMIADILYDSAAHVLAAQSQSVAVSFDIWQPLGSIGAFIIAALSESLLAVILHCGFWIHVGLVLVFLNILPYSKHFHIITVVPNVFFQSLDPSVKLKSMEDLEGKVEREETLGIRSINDLSGKGILDLYTCTECGRCTDHCPAAQTGKMLSPKQLTIDLRDYLYDNEKDLISNADKASDLVSDVIDPQVLWACTTCGACEQECPVMISYVDKIVDMRRHLVLEKGDCDSSLQTTFQNMEVTGSPYGATSDQRLDWAEGIDVPIRAETEDVDVLFWVGCAPATDQRAKGIAQALAHLLNKAGVRWAVLGQEESCTGDAARRAGNEFLFQTMAQANIEILNKYETKTIITACPHCFNTIKNEYPDFGGNYEVLHHSEYLNQLLADGKLKATQPINAKITYHDSCYLGRGNGKYDQPRDLLKSIPGIELVEPEATRDRGLCCGAGGAQMFKEEESGDERISARRTSQLLDTGAETICTACPFCMRMLTDEINSTEQTQVKQLDIAEILWQSVQTAS